MAARLRPVALFLVIATATALAVTALASGGDETSFEAGAEAVLEPRAQLPQAPEPLAEGIAVADAAWRQALDDWRGAGSPPPVPEELAGPAGYVQRAARRLAGDRRLARNTLADLPNRLARQMKDAIRATRDLRRLAAGWPAHEIRTGPPTSLEVLMPAYRAAKRRFGIHFRILAAVNHIESAFGRARNDSVAGAQGPMQFIPSTWEIYGMGGDIRDPHDAILGAANYLDQSGAPQSYGDALYAYNPSRLYVDAVLRYARLIARDRESFYLLYTWEP